jgi:hypothetical protein
LIDRLLYVLHQKEEQTEITDYLNRIFSYHIRMDGNIPDGAVIFIGDSLIQSLCVSAIACPSVNYGIGGDTTVGVLHRLPFYHSITRASVVVLSIGINDMKYRTNEEILSNYKIIINKIPHKVRIIFSALLASYRRRV